MLDTDGFAVLPNVWTDRELDALAEVLEHVQQANGDAYAIRNLLEAVPAVRQAAMPGSKLQELAASVLGRDCFPVRGILFDKRPEANWLVPWHQDLTIAVARRVETPGFGPWSEKAGVTHVQPPVAVMARMVAVRLHLDDCGVENGPVRVLPGSHCEGRLTASDIEQWKSLCEAVTCAVPRGGVLLMRPLLLHASSPAIVPSRRRVVHIEYAAEELPGELCWRGRCRIPVTRDSVR